MKTANTYVHTIDREEAEIVVHIYPTRDSYMEAYAYPIDSILPPQKIDEYNNKLGNYWDECYELVNDPNQ